MSFVVDPKSLSQTQIKQDLEDFLASRPDAAKWTGFFNSSVGQTIVELLAGVSTYFTYNNIVARREAFLQYVSNRSSAIGISQSLGYSTFKGKNQRLTLTVIPTTTTLITKYTIIGSVKDLDLVILEDTPVQSGVQIDIEAVIGNLVSEDITIDTDGIASFRFQKFPVSEDYRLLLNSVEVSTSSRILDLENDLFSVITNVFDSVDVMYLNNDTAPVQYTTGDTLTLEFVSLKEVSFTDFEVNYDFGDIVSFIRSSSYEPAETTDEIKINAPLFHETQTIIRGRKDFLKTFRFLDTSFVDTNQRDVSAAVIELTYVKDTGAILTSAEKTVFVDEIFKNILMGIPPPEIIDPIKVPLKIAIRAVLKSSGDVSTAVEEVLSQLEKKLELSINFEDVENSIEAYDFIKIARLSISSETWTASTQYEKGFYASPSVDNGFIYYLDKILYFSGASEPVFPTTVNDQVIDQDLIWEAKLVDYCETEITTWQSNTSYELGALVVPTLPNGRMYKVVNYVNRSGGVNENQLIEFSDVPDSGTFRIHFGLEKTIDLPFNANNIDVQTALNNLDSLSEVLVTGDFTSGFDLLFQGADGSKEQVEVALTDPGVDEIQVISFSEVPNAGDFGLSFNGDVTTAIPFTAIAADIKSALEALPSIDQVSVSGNFSSNFFVTFEGVNAKQDVPLLDLALLANPGADEIQVISFSSIPTSGTWRVHFNGEWTGDLAYNATSSELQSELNGLSSLSSVSVTGNYNVDFTVLFQGANGKQDQPLLDVTHPGQNAIQNIQFSLVPDTGLWRLEFGSEETADLAFNASTTDIETALEALPSISDVSVTGDYGSSLTVEFQGVDGLKDQTLLTVSSVGVDEVQLLDFSEVPVDGDFQLDFDGELTSNISYLADANDIKDALEALSNIDEVSVIGDFSGGFYITFEGVNAKADVLLLALGTNTLVYNSVAEITQVQITSTAIDGKTFLLYDENGSVGVWFDVDNSGTPIPAAALAADRSIEVTTVLSGDSLGTVANKLAAAIDADAAFSAGFASTTVTITDATEGLRTDASDVDTTFSISTHTQGAQASVVITPQEFTKGKTPANQLTRIDQPITITTTNTQVGLLPAQSLLDGVTPITQTAVESTAGEPELSNLERSGNPVIVTIAEDTKGEFPANNLLIGASPITVTVSTLVDASDVEPIWPTNVGDTIQDGDILWLAQKLTGTPSTWQPFTNYFKGDYVAPSSPVLDAENDNLMFQCFSFLGTSGTSEPSFPTTVDAEVTDNNVLWVAKNATENPPSLEWNEYFEIDQTITLE